LLGDGSGGLLSPVLAPSPVRSTPLVADLNGDGVADVAVLTQTGQVLLRRGLAGQPGAFAPPVVLNPDPRKAARDLALVQNTGGPFLAALDAQTLAVTLHFPGHAGFTTATGLDLPAGLLPDRLAADDLNGDGLGDLVITAAASDRVFVALQTAP